MTVPRRWSCAFVGSRVLHTLTAKEQTYGEVISMCCTLTRLPCLMPPRLLGTGSLVMPSSSFSRLQPYKHVRQMMAYKKGNSRRSDHVKQAVRHTMSFESPTLFVMYYYSIIQHFTFIRFTSRPAVLAARLGQRSTTHPLLTRARSLAQRSRRCRGLRGLATQTTTSSWPTNNARALQDHP